MNIIRNNRKGEDAPQPRMPEPPLAGRPPIADLQRLAEMSKLPPAPRLPPAPPPIPPETEAEVLARYGKSLTETPKVILAAADATRIGAEKLVEESAAAVEAARGILKQLEEEQETYAREIRQRTETYALRLTEYLTRCHIAIQSMARHREAIIEVSHVEPEPAPPPAAAPEVKHDDEEMHSGDDQA